MMARAVKLLFGTILLIGIASGAAVALPEADIDDFEPSQSCGCHAALLEQWSPSMHAQALTDPLYIYKREQADLATDGALGEFCDTCHAPAAVMAGQRLVPLEEMAPQLSEGVACDFCHQVTGTGEPIGNTSQTIELDGVKRAQFDDSVSPAHETAYSAFHESAEFCGACHDVYHPVNNLQLEATYTEWSKGPYAAEGIVCQDCHMTPGPGVTKPNPGVAAAGGPQRDHIYLMTFVGGNVGLGDAQLAEERLRAATELDLAAPGLLEPGSTTDVSVTITNVGAGHFVPTGLTDVRQMWLEVIAEGPDGEVIEIGRRDFGTVFADADGNYPVDIWDAVSVQSDDRIPPRESVSETYSFEMPDEDFATISATLYYRSCSEEMAEKAGVEIPTTTMAVGVQTVYASEAARSAAASGAREDESGIPWTAIIIAALVIAIAAATIYAVQRTRQPS